MTDLLIHITLILAELKFEGAPIVLIAYTICEELHKVPHLAVTATPSPPSVSSSTLHTDCTTPSPSSSPSPLPPHTYMVPRSRPTPIAHGTSTPSSRRTGGWTYGKPTCSTLAGGIPIFALSLRMSTSGTPCSTCGRCLSPSLPHPYQTPTLTSHYMQGGKYLELSNKLINAGATEGTRKRERSEESWAEAVHEAFEEADPSMPTSSRVQLAMSALLRVDKAMYYRCSPSASASPSPRIL